MKTEVNFILINNKNAEKQQSEQKKAIKLLILLHLFFYWQHNQRRVAIPYTYKPLYTKFKMSWCKFIGKIYYLVLFLTPAILTIRLILSYNNNLWWWLILLLITPWFIFALINLIRDCTCKVRIKTHIASITESKSIMMKFGNPGSGKTSSSIFDIKILADIIWEKICIKYKLLEPYLDMIPFFPAIQRERAEEIIESYQFYKNSGTYPCLWTSIPVFIDGIPTNILEDVHLMQEERLPYGSSGFIDETKGVIPPELHRTNPESIVDMAKLPRHFRDFHFMLTDQAKEGVFNAWRRCTAENIFLEKQKWILKPRFLIWLTNKLILNMKKPTKAKVTILKVLEKITSCIGYRKYYYCSFGNEYKQTIEKTKTFILPTFLNADYDDRCFRKAYKCLGKPLRVKKWSSLELTQEQVKNIFSPKIKELAKSQKKKSTKEKNNET